MEVLIGCASNLIAKIGEHVIIRTKLHFGYVMYYKNYIESLKREVNNLKVKSHGMKQEVEQAITNGDIVAPQVDEWFRNVDIVFEESTAFIEDEVRENKAILKGWFPNIRRRYILGKKAKKKTEKVVMLTSEIFSKISYPAPPLAVGERSVGKFRNFESRTPTIDKLMKWLKDDNRNIISLCGMGGSGKTTMVEEVARRVKGEKRFDEIIMAVVTKEPNVMMVQESLAHGLRLKFKSSTLEGRADELWRRLLHSKKGNLVILDDVWKHIDLKDIGIPFGKEYNCTVLLTSRIVDACKAMGCNTNDILELDILTPPEAWSLLGEMVGHSLQDPELRNTASEIANKCGGLPIAIVCLGRSLKDKRKEVWDDTLQKLQRSIVPENIEGVKEDVYKSLQASYDLLEDEEAKKMFIVCCLYPEYADVPLEALVRCGIGLDFFRGVDLLIRARDRVHTLADKLKGRFLLLPGAKKSTVKVHNVVRAVGISVASTSNPNSGQFHAVVMHEDRWPRGMRYKDCNAVSVVSNEISEIPLRGLNFQKIELLQIACPKLSLEKLDSIFERMDNARVVELWNMSISSFSSLLVSLPRNIFSLCMDCKMENIGDDIRPEEFKNLEILSFGNCDIKELPMNVGFFANLRLLDLSRCHELERITPGVICSLHQLEELDTGSKVWGDGKGDASLNELDSLTNLIYLGIRIKSLSFLPKNPLFEKLQRYVISVGIQFEKAHSFNNRMILLKHESTDTHLGGGIDKLLRKNTEKVLLSGDGMKTALKELAAGGFQQVKSLTVECCYSEGTQYLADHYSYSSNGAGVFSNLEKLHMEKMWLLKGILRHHGHGHGLPTKSFTNLRKIRLSYVPEIMHVFTLSVAKNLVMLKSLYIEYCRNMQQVILNPWPLESRSENKIQFPMLTELILKDIVSLVCFSQGVNMQVVFPQLKVLKLEYLQNFQTFCPAKANFNGGVEYQSLVDHKVEFSSLAELTITNIVNIKEVWCGHLSNLVDLQGLYIQLCHMMEEVISIQRPSITTSEEVIVFPKLKEIILFGLNRLTYFCRGIHHLEFPQLRVLRLRWLTHFRTFCQQDTIGLPSSVFNDKVTFSSLETLEVSELDSVDELWSNQLATSQFDQLKYLRVDKCHKLVNIFPSDLQTLFPNLEKLEVEKCNSLQHIWGPKGVPFKNLKTLHIYECPDLKNICSFHTFKGLSSLQILDISNCKMMEAVVADDDYKYGKIDEVVLLNKLEEVKLSDLPNLSYFSHTKCNMEMEGLTEVIVKSCPDMYTFSVSSVATPNLKCAVIDDVKSWLGDLNSTMRKRFSNLEY